MNHDDPPRLMDLAGDAELRAALRVVSREVPTPEQLEQLANSVAQALGQGVGASSVALIKLSVLKVVGAITLGALLTVGALWLARDEHVERVTAHGATQAESEVSPAEQPATATSRARRQAFESRAQRSGSETDADPRVSATRVAETALPSAPAAVASEGSLASSVELRSAPRPSAPAPHAGRARLSGKGPAALKAPSHERTAAREESADAEPEVALIAAAQHALPIDARRTLALTSRHRELYPHGEFAEERDVLSLDALKRLKQSGALEAKGREFLAQYPSSVHAARVRALLEAGGP